MEKLYPCGRKTRRVYLRILSSLPFSCFSFASAIWVRSMCSCWMNGAKSRCAFLRVSSSSDIICGFKSFTTSEVFGSCCTGCGTTSHCGVSTAGFFQLLNILQMLYDASIHVLLVCSIVQRLSIALEVSIETLFDAMKQQYKYSISTYKYRYRRRKQSSSLSSPISCWAIL